MAEYLASQVSTLKIVIKSDNDRTFEGYATVEVVDKEGEITVRDELLKTLDAWLERGAPMSYAHTNQIVGKGLEYWATDYDLDGVKIPAIKIKGMIYKHTQLDDQVWEQIKDGTLKGLSYGGAIRSGREPEVQKDGSIAYRLKDLELYEIAICSQPTCDLALITNVNNLAKAEIKEKFTNMESICRGGDDKCYQSSSLNCIIETDEEVIASQNENYIRGKQITPTVNKMVADNEKKTDDKKEEEKEKSVSGSIPVADALEIAKVAAKSAVDEYRTTKKEEDKKEDDKKDGDKKDDEDKDKAVTRGDMIKFVDQVVKYMNETDKKIDGMKKGMMGMTASNGQKITFPDESYGKEEPGSMNARLGESANRATDKGEKAGRPNVLGGKAEDESLTVIQMARKGKSMEDITRMIRNREIPELGGK